MRTEDTREEESIIFYSESLDPLLILYDLIGLKNNTIT